MNRFYIADMRLAREKAKSLKTIAAQIGRSVTLSECREAIAMLYGYRNWVELLRVTECGIDPSPASDATQSPEITIVADSLGIDRITASFVLGALCPRMPGMRRWVEARPFEPGENDRLVPQDGTRQERRPGDAGEPPQAIEISEDLVKRLAGADGILSASGRLEVHRQFVAQVGPRWSSLEEQPAHIRLLLALLAVHGLRGSKEAKPLFWTATEVMKNPVADRDERMEGLAAEYLRDTDVRGFIDIAAARHAFVFTVVMRVLDECRTRGGILPITKFLWLKDCDPKAWNALMSAGRRVALYQGVGVLAHYHSERKAEEPITGARVDLAVDSLESWFRHVAEIRSLPGIPLKLGAEHFHRID